VQLITCQRAVISAGCIDELNAAAEVVAYTHNAAALHL